METVTIRESHYEDLTESLNAKTYDLSRLKGYITGLSMFADSHPELVAQQIKQMAAKIDAGVDITDL